MGGTALPGGVAGALWHGDGSAAGRRRCRRRRRVGHRAGSTIYADDEPEFLEDSGGMRAGRGAGGGDLVGGVAEPLCFHGGDAHQWSAGGGAESPATLTTGRAQQEVVKLHHHWAEPLRERAKEASDGGHRWGN